MSLFFSLFIRCFWLNLMMAGALSASGRARPRPTALLLAFIGGLALAALTVLTLPSGAKALFYFALGRLLLLFCALIYWFCRGPGAGLLLWCAAGYLSGGPFFAAPVMSAFSSSSVVNTDFILHCFAVLAAALLSALLVLWLYVLKAQLSRRPWLALATLLVLVNLAVWLVWLGADLQLAAIKLQWLEISSGQLRFLARAEYARSWVGYLAVAVGFMALLWAYCFAHRPRARRWRAIDEKKSVAGRLALAEYNGSRRLCLQAAAALALVLATALHWDLVASRPPALSEAKRVELAADGFIHLPIEPFKDNDLHRFGWVSPEGKLVRFFVVNRFKDEWAPAVVFDACLLCGDTGYALVDDQVVCVSCGVRLYRPAVGKAGGCNPVPIVGWQMDEREIRVPRKGLEQGLTLFKTVLEIEVRDPVDGQPLKNTTAPFRYSYGTQTYFFHSEANYQRFLDDPKAYVRD